MRVPVAAAAPLLLAASAIPSMRNQFRPSGALRPTI